MADPSSDDEMRSSDLDNGFARGAKLAASRGGGPDFRRAPGMSTGPGAPVDVVSVLKPAPVLPGETELIEAVNLLLRLAQIEGGAERSLLVLPQGEGFRIAAEARDGSPEALNVGPGASRNPAEAAGDEANDQLPGSLLRHVAGTRQTLLVDDAALPGPFSADPYLSRYRPRSVLCLPLPRLAGLNGILYMESRQRPQAFAPQRVVVLEGLASQAVVSLENAHRCAELLRENEAQRQALAGLSARNAGFAAIFESALEAIIAIDSAQRVVYFNVAAERMFGSPAAEVIGQSFERFIPARFRGAHREHVRKFAESGVTRRVMGVPLEVYGLRSNGEEFPVDAAISQGDADGERLQVVMLRDVSERKRAEAELQRYREHLEELVAERTAELTAVKEHLDIELADLKRLHVLSTRLLAEKEQDALLREVLQAAMALLGAVKGKLQRYDEHDHVLRLVAQIGFNQDFVDFFDAVPSFFAICGTAMGLNQRVIVEDVMNEPRFTSERDIYLANGVVAMQSTPLYGIGGELYGVLTTHFETPHRPSERELRMLDLYAQQATRIIENSERTAQMALARGKAEEAEHLKSTFLTTMSHELRTPLNAILGYAQILAREPARDERLADGLDTIRESGEYLLSLINDILDLSKVEAGRLELNPGPVNFQLFLLSVAKIIAIKTEQKGLAFVFEAPPELPAVLLDEKRLRQVLLNLLGNAVKFTEQGQVSFSVQSRPAVGDRLCLRFEIRDTGIGIAADQLETIFQRFEQLGAAQQRSGGTGLGLTISRQLVRLMGSDIEVESQPGQGSLFRFELEVAVVGDARAAPELAPGLVTGYHGPRRKLLIADDVEANRRVLADFLASLGFDIREAGDGREAVALVEAERPDLVLMDVTMPLLNGPEATRRIHEIPGCETLPVFAVSASTVDKEAERRVAVGASAFVSKPIDFERLLELLGSRLGLTWIEVPRPESGESGSLVAPPQDEMKVLRQLALAGNMRDIKQRSNYLKNVDPRYGPFADRLSDLARRYQSQAVLALVEHYLKESER